jgi:hypothetical protein
MVMVVDHVNIPDTGSKITHKTRISDHFSLALFTFKSLILIFGSEYIYTAFRNHTFQKEEVKKDQFGNFKFWYSRMISINGTRSLTYPYYPRNGSENAYQRFAFYVIHDFKVYIKIFY